MQYVPALTSIKDLIPYQPGKSIESLMRETGCTRILKLASNENVYGPSPKVLAQWPAFSQTLLLYPEGDAYELKAALSQHWQLAPEYFIVGNGSEDVIDNFFRFAVSVGDEVIIPQYAFSCYAIRAQSVGGTIVWAQSQDYHISLEAILSRITKVTKLICLASPNNPTGQGFSPKALKDWIAAIPSHILILLDEAYYEYLSEDALSHSHQWVFRYPNLLITRTFSKVYGLAGLRLGYGIAHPDLIGWVNRVRQPFNTSRIAQQAGVIALSDQHHVLTCRDKNTQQRQQLEARLKAIRVPLLPSCANFITLHTGHRTQLLYDTLLRQGIIVRPLGGFGMPDFLRVTIGTAEQCEIFISAFKMAWENQHE